MQGQKIALNFIAEALMASMERDGVNTNTNTNTNTKTNMNGKISVAPGQLFVPVLALLLFLMPHAQMVLGDDIHTNLHHFALLLEKTFYFETLCLSIGSVSWVILKRTLGARLDRALFYQLWLCLMAASVISFNLDAYGVFIFSQNIGLDGATGASFDFSRGFMAYSEQSFYEHAALYLSAWVIFALGLLIEKSHKPLFLYAFMKRMSIIIILLPMAYAALPLFLSLKSSSSILSFDSKVPITIITLIGLMQGSLLMLALLQGLRQKELTRGFVVKKLQAILMLNGLFFGALLMLWVKSSLYLNTETTWPYGMAPSWQDKLVDFGKMSSPIILLCLIAYVLWRYQHGKSKLGEDEEKVSADFGSARFASLEDLKEANFYDETIGPLLGLDKEGAKLYSPLTNKLIISPPGGGKTTASSIPLLLEHDGPIFAFDVKGELWAVTAAHRQNVMKRQVITIDPFKLTYQKSFRAGKDKGLLREYHINPFEYLPKNPLALDRIINAFAASFLIQSDAYTSHFDENAKILIRGTIDYLIRSDEAEKSLPILFKLLSGSFEENKALYKKMEALGGRAMAAANQISRVGGNERGSILSTTYRQIDWLGDSNVREVLSNSNFDLRDFLKGNMDIYVIIPEDQVKEHGRLMRMMMALLMGQIIQADPSELPTKKMVFLLEELAQLGNYPDVELCIEVLRARNVVIWSVFQSLSQIELFEKPDLFKSVPLKQIFRTDDVKTMEWVQAMAGKKTILTKSKSEDKSKSRDSGRWLSGSTSESKSASIHETGVDLLPLNEIREMDEEEQLVFYKAMPVIRCKKARYFMDKSLKKRAMNNPLA